MRRTYTGMGSAFVIFVGLVIWIAVWGFIFIAVLHFARKFW